MISKRIISATCGTSLLILLSACNEKMPFEAITTTDSDWTPTVVVMANDYNRIQFGIEAPPRRELLRNIVSYAVQIREEASGKAVFLDTIGNYIPPGYLYFGPKFYWPETSSPVLQSSTSYSVQVSVNYSVGPRKYSDWISFATPPERSRVTRRISIPGDDMSVAMILAFHKSDLIICNTNGKLVKFDSSTGERAVLSNSFYPPSNSSNESFYGCLTAVGDTLYTFYSNRNSDQFTLVAVDLNTLRVNSSTRVSLPGKRLASIFGNGSSLYSLWYGNGNQQVALIDPTKGTISSTMPEVPGVIYTSDDVISDGKNLWVSTHFDFHNGFIRYDPATLQSLNEQHNPVFSSEGLAWDGEHFWVIDAETQSMAKVQFLGN